MPETVSPSVGYKDEFHLYDGTALYKLRGVTGFDVPTGGTREQVDVTDLDAEDWRRQFISTFYEAEDITVSLNYRPLSDTDTKLSEARDADDVRAFLAVLAVQGIRVAQVGGTCRCTGYGPDRISVGDVKTATASFRIVSVDTLETYEEPTP
jgi:hypothetical protein